MNKRGQFFIIAAIIIVAVLASISSVATQARTGEPNARLYDLSSEIAFESRRVLDYGVYTGNNPQELLANFLRQYIDTVNLEQAVFIYGNQESLQARSFSGAVIGQTCIGQSANPGSQCISIGGVHEQGTSLPLSSGVPSNEQQIQVRLQNLTYHFSLEPGQNFFLILMQHRNEELFVSAE